MKTFGQVIVEARKAAGLTQKAVAERFRRGDGRKVLPPYLNERGRCFRAAIQKDDGQRAGSNPKSRESPICPHAGTANLNAISARHNGILTRNAGVLSP
jgi:hypothetical protein